MTAKGSGKVSSRGRKNQTVFTVKRNAWRESQTILSLKFTIKGENPSIMNVHLAISKHAAIVASHAILHDGYSNHFKQLFLQISWISLWASLLSLIDNLYWIRYATQPKGVEEQHGNPDLRYVFTSNVIKGEACLGLAQPCDGVWTVLPQACAEVLLASLLATYWSSPNHNLKDDPWNYSIRNSSECINKQVNRVVSSCHWGRWFKLTIVRISMPIKEANERVVTTCTLWSSQKDGFSSRSNCVWAWWWSWSTSALCVLARRLPGLAQGVLFRPGLEGLLGVFSSLHTAASIFGPSDILLIPSSLADNCLPAEEGLKRHIFSTSLPDVEEGSESSVVVVSSSLPVARNLMFGAVWVRHSP